MRPIAPAFHTALLALPVIALPFLQLACASLEVAWPPAESWTRQEAGESALRRQYPDAGAIHLVDEGRMEVFGQGEVGFSVFTHHRATRILTTAGQRHAYVVIPYTEGNEVSDIAGRTVRPDGSVVPLEPRNVFDVSLYPSFIFFSDQRARIFTMPAVENGSVVEYSYTLTIRTRTLWHGWAFQSDVPVVSSRFTLVRPAEWEIAHRVYGATLTPREIRGPQGFKTVTEWTMEDVPPTAAEIAMPSARERTIRLSLAPLGFRSWNDVASWYNGLAAPRMRTNAASRSRLSSIIAGAASDTAKLRKIYEWVRDNVRYVAVEIGIGGFQPHDANEVCANLYGDCKDMAGLLCALAREAGVQVDPVLVSTWQNGPPDTTLPSPLHFNHVIAYAPSSGIWMDPTDKGAPFGQVPWYDQGLPVLVVNGDGRGELRTTPRASAEAQTILLDWDVRLAGDGSASISGRTVLSGSAAADLRDDLVYRDLAARRFWMETYLAARCPGIRLDSMALRGLDPPVDPLTLEYTFTTPVFAPPRGSALILRPGLTHASDLPDYFRSRRRTLPVRLRFGSVTETRLILRADRPLRAEEATDSVSSAFGTYTCSRRAREGTVTYHSRLRLEGGDIPAGKYPEFQAFLDTLRVRELLELEIMGAW